MMCCLCAAYSRILRKTTPRLQCAALLNALFRRILGYRKAFEYQNCTHVNLEVRNANYNEESNGIRVNEILQDDIHDKENFPL